VVIDAAAYRAMIEEFEKAGHIEGYEVTWKRKDGALANLRLSGKRIDVRNDAPESFEVIAENITERRALEQQLLHSQKMEAVGRLAGGIAHDFNNLLGVIIGYSELMLSQIKTGDPAQKYNLEIRKAADRAAGLTRQLLAFSRKQVLEPKVLDLNTIVTEVEKLLHRLIGEDIELVVSLAPELQRVKADPGQIEQVIMNLAVNARDAMPKGGKLFMKTSNVVFDDAFVEQHLGSTAGRYAMLTISDTGAGMDAETRLRIFEPFFTTKERGKGTGLGLATVYGIVKQSGGYITVYSEPGHGSTFKIWLPAVDDIVVAPITDGRVQETLAGNETILVAEDADQLRELVRGLLEISGYKVLEARSPEEAIDVVRGTQGKIHLLLTDVVMPGMSGLDLADRFMSLSPETKVLFMSGYADDVISGRGIPETDANLLQKPFTRQSLLRKVRESLQSPGVKR
jgi:signal transduction histidine kinase/ActR/RegA family two-component response regulator